MYADGAIRGKGSQLQTGAVVAGKGTFYLGQKQGTIGGEFLASKSFSGGLSQVNLWNTTMNSSVVKELAKQCWQNSVGNIVAWRDFHHNIYGGVKVETAQTCLSSGELSFLHLLVVNFA